MPDFLWIALSCLLVGTHAICDVDGCSPPSPTMNVKIDLDEHDVVNGPRLAHGGNNEVEEPSREGPALQTTRLWADFYDEESMVANRDVSEVADEVRDTCPVKGGKVVIDVSDDKPSSSRLLLRPAVVMSIFFQCVPRCYKRFEVFSVCGACHWRTRSATCGPACACLWCQVCSQMLKAICGLFGVRPDIGAPDRLPAGRPVLACGVMEVQENCPVTK